jgi:hypothetical protein
VFIKKNQFTITPTMPTYKNRAFILRSIVLQMKEVLPHVHDFKKCEKFVEELRRRINPRLQQINIQLECVLNNGTQKKPEYEAWVYVRSLYDLTSGWDEQWVRLLTQLEEGDDFVDNMLLWTFSGSWQREDPQRIVVAPFFDLPFDHRRKIDMNVTIPLLKLRERTHAPLPGSVYVPSEVLKKLLQKVKTDTPSVNHLSYFERKIFFGNVRTAYDTDLQKGWFFEEFIMLENKISFYTDNRYGGVYLNNNVNTFQAFKSLAKEKQIRLFQIWKDEPTEKKLIDEITAMVAPMYSCGKGGRNRHGFY